MRDIMFRAKESKSGMWIYGYFYEECGNSYIIMDRQRYSTLNRNETHIVDQNTIGQFTGLKDKNGVEIYEGDIVKYDDTCDPDYIRYGEIDTVSFVDCCFYPVSEEWCQNIEVIGNIYDDKDLVDNII